MEGMEAMGRVCEGGESLILEWILGGVVVGGGMRAGRKRATRRSGGGKHSRVAIIN